MITAIARLNSRTQGTHRFRCLLAIIVLVLEWRLMQRENVERSPGSKHTLKTAKHRRGVGGSAQAAGQAEKRELGHRGTAPNEISTGHQRSITRTALGSTKFDFRIRGDHLLDTSGSTNPNDTLVMNERVNQGRILAPRCACTAVR